MNSRLIIASISAIFVIATTVVLIQFAKGYRPDIENRQIKATGILVATSDPDGAQILIDNQLKSATDDTINLEPGNYHVNIKKEGYIPWQKQIKIEKELVTQTDAKLFPAVPNLQPITHSGALNPYISPKGTKLIYAIPEPEQTDLATASARINSQSTALSKDGLWLLELTNLPLGFNRDPKQLVIGPPPNITSQTFKWTSAQYIWAPDEREILAVFYPEQNDTNQLDNPLRAQTQQVATPSAVFRINTGQNQVQGPQLTNVKAQYQDILSDWQVENQQLLEAQIAQFPEKFTDTIATSASELKFSPDETKVLYIATASAQLAKQIIPPVPAASSQPQSRVLKPNYTYLYDRKEDRNFIILDDTSTLQIQQCLKAHKLSENMDNVSDDGNSPDTCPKLMWFPTSRHLVYFVDNKVSIMEYDSTNRQTVYAGPIEQNYVFAHPSGNELLLITTLNPDAQPLPNLYTLSLR